MNATKPVASMRRRVIWILVGLSITAVALVYSLAQINLSELAAQIESADYSMVVPVLLLLLGHFYLKAQRWAMLLTPIGAFSASQVAPPMMIGAAANNILPAHLGDVLRAAIFARRYGKPFTGVLVSQMVERLLDAAAVLTIFLVGVFALPEVPAVLRASGWAALAVTVVAVLGMVLLLKNGDIMLAIWDRITVPIGDRLRTRGRRILADVILSLSSIGKLHRLAFLFGNSLVQWLLMTGVIWLSLLAFGSSASFLMSMIVLTAIILAVSVPGAPGYVGSIQAAFLLALTPFGADANTAFGASVFFLVVPWISVTSSGACYFVYWHLRLADVREEIEHIEDRT